MNTSIVISECAWNCLTRHCQQQTPDEAFAILAVCLSSSGHHVRGLVTHVFVPDATDYEKQTPVSARVTKEWLQTVLVECADRQMGAIYVHSHPFEKQYPHESQMDLDAAQLMCPAIAKAFPGMPIGTMVLNGSATQVEAHLYNRRRRRREPVDAVYVPRANGLQTMLPTSSSRRKDGAFDQAYWSRLALAFGEEAISLFSSMEIGIVGAGSLGEFLAIQAAKMGFGRVTLVDMDRLGMENVQRSWEATPRDGKKRPHKVDIVRRAIRRSRCGAKVSVIRGDIREAAVQEELTRCDVLVCGLDNVAARFVTSHLASVHGQILFDVGVGIDVDGGKLKSVRGQVVRLIPGQNLCHSCAGFFSARDARLGLMSDAELERRQRRGYIKGSDVRAPSVMPLNLHLASLGMWEVMKYLTNATPDRGADIVSVDLLSHEMRAVTYPRNEDGRRTNCAVCSPEGYLMRGDHAPFLTRRTTDSIPELPPEIKVTENEALNGPDPAQLRMAGQ